MFVELIDRTETEDNLRAEDIVFTTLPSLGMDRMTAEGVEFVLCTSALTAQV
ncbi:hypothetical protein [Streptomyces sp. G-G2]|uniref:hypothetical protein n=1 Tax=Streptomyces sp. G-G2 TaxID=3046201 RepID=UPI0024B984B6|nr:hypothetical protein [Streptomyces sp. G-G2]MDJ0382357.1 hypothetical protein [Streptomyces sp. G-G2]